MRVPGSILAVILAPFATTLASAQGIDRRLNVVNDSKHDVIELYGSPVGQPPSQINMLGEGVLPPGGSMILDFNDGSGYCRFALRAVFKDGVQLERDSVNVCEVGTYRYTD